jgi:hypothetical protein
MSVVINLLRSSRKIPFTIPFNGRTHYFLSPQNKWKCLFLIVLSFNSCVVLHGVNNLTVQNNVAFNR